MGAQGGIYSLTTWISKKMKGAERKLCHYLGNSLLLAIGAACARRWRGSLYNRPVSDRVDYAIYNLQGSAVSELDKGASDYRKRKLRG